MSKKKVGNLKTGVIAYMNVSKTSRTAIDIKKALRIFRDSIRNWRASAKIEILCSRILALRSGAGNVTFFEDNIRVLPNWRLVFVDNVDCNCERSNFGRRRRSFTVFRHDFDVPSFLRFKIESRLRNLQQRGVVQLVHDLERA